MLATQYRLRSKNSIDTVFKNGRTVFSGFLFLKFLPNKLPQSRFAFSIGLKFSKQATIRNRAKRLLRAAVNQNLAKIKPGYDLVFFLKNATPEQLEAKNLDQHLKNILQRAKLTEKNNHLTI